MFPKLSHGENYSSMGGGGNLKVRRGLLGIYMSLMGALCFLVFHSPSLPRGRPQALPSMCI